MREVDFGPGRSIRARGCGCAGFATLEVGTHTLRLIRFQRTGMGLFLGDAYGLENIENGSALDFELTC